jgi:hypothetical protein
MQKYTIELICDNEIDSSHVRNEKSKAQHVPGKNKVDALCYYLYNNGAWGKTTLELINGSYYVTFPNIITDIPDGCFQGEEYWQCFNVTEE